MTAVYAHRGATDAAVENSLAAFADARRLGADGVELDVRATADGVLVVHHDPFLHRGDAVAATAAVDLPPYVPRLDQALDACEGLVVNVEIKNAPGDPGYDATGAFVGAVVEVVAGAGDRGDGDRFLLSSFQEEDLEAARRCRRTPRLGLLLSPVHEPGPLVETAVARGYSAVHPFVTQVDAALVARAHQAGLEVNVWTVNPEDQLRAMVALGVDGIMTDRVAVAVAVVYPDRPHPDGSVPITTQVSGVGVADGRPVVKNWPL